MNYNVYHAANMQAMFKQAEAQRRNEQRLINEGAAKKQLPQMDSKESAAKSKGRKPKHTYEQFKLLYKAYWACYNALDSECQLSNKDFCNKNDFSERTYFHFKKRLRSQD